jgi:hypothetical protein
MLIAELENQAIDAWPGGKAYCPICSELVLAKCGSINIWHWAHKAREDCDHWAEGETRWHAHWKRLFPRRCREIVMGPHRADIKLPKLTVELQASSISAEQIHEREEFYGNLFWIIRADQLTTFNLRNCGYISYRWKYPRKCWWTAHRPLFFDFGDNRIFQIKKLYSDLPCGGWGLLRTKAETIRSFYRIGGLKLLLKARAEL